MRYPSEESLPKNYARDRLVLLLRDPRLAFSYWELTSETWSELQTGQPCLRLVDQDGQATVVSILNAPEGKHYFQLPGPGYYRLELGTLIRDAFTVRLTSNQVRSVQPRPLVNPVAGLPSSPGETSQDAKDTGKAPGLELNTDVVLYGRVRPGGTLKVGREEVPTGSDGSFSIRLSLADGVLITPITATNPEGEEVIITPVITQEVFEGEKPR